MADAAPRGGGFASRGGDRGGDRGRGDRGRGRGRGRGRRGGKSDEKEWQPVTKLGRLVKAGKIKSMEEIYLHSLPIKEYQIVDFFLPKLKDEVMKVRSIRRYSWIFFSIVSGRAPEKFLCDNRLIEIFSPYYRSSPSRSRPVPVSVPVSRPLSSLVTLRATLVWVSRPLRRLPPLSAPPSLLPSLASSPSVVVTGVPTLVLLTRSPLRRAASAVPSLSA